MFVPPFRYSKRASIWVLMLLILPLSNASAAPQQVNHRLFIPYVATPPPQVHEVQFASAVDDNLPVKTATSFAYGIQRLYMSTVVEGGSGTRLRAEWTVNGQRSAGLDSTATLNTLPAQRITRSVCFGSFGSCGAPLPRGTYQVHVLLNDVLMQEAEAVIQ